MVKAFFLNIVGSVSKIILSVEDDSMHLAFATREIKRKKDTFGALKSDQSQKKRRASKTHYEPLSLPAVSTQHIASGHNANSSK